MTHFIRLLLMGVFAIAISVGCSPTDEEPIEIEDEEEQGQVDNEQSTEIPEESKEEQEKIGDTSNQNNDSATKPKDDDPVPKPTITAENESFKIYQPKSDTVIGSRLVLKGDARVFEGTVHYYLEDGHNVLAEGTTQATKGGPEWGSFEVNTDLEEQVTSPSGMLMIYEESAKDGSRVNELTIPVKFKYP